MSKNQPSPNHEQISNVKDEAENVASQSLSAQQNRWKLFNQLAEKACSVGLNPPSPVSFEDAISFFPSSTNKPPSPLPLEDVFCNLPKPKPTLPKLNVHYAGRPFNDRETLSSFLPNTNRINDPHPKLLPPLGTQYSWNRHYQCLLGKDNEPEFHMPSSISFHQAGLDRPCYCSGDGRPSLHSFAPSMSHAPFPSSPLSMNHPPMNRASSLCQCFCQAPSMSHAPSPAQQDFINDLPINFPPMDCAKASSPSCQCSRLASSMSHAPSPSTPFQQNLKLINDLPMNLPPSGKPSSPSCQCFRHAPPTSHAPFPHRPPSQPNFINDLPMKLPSMHGGRPSCQCVHRVSPMSHAPSPPLPNFINNHPMSLPLMDVASSSCQCFHRASSMNHAPSPPLPMNLPQMNGESSSCPCFRPAPSMSHAPPPPLSPRQSFINDHYPCNCRNADECVSCGQKYCCHNPHIDFSLFSVRAPFIDARLLFSKLSLSFGGEPPVTCFQAPPGNWRPMQNINDQSSLQTGNEPFTVCKPKGQFNFKHQSRNTLCWIGNDSSYKLNENRAQKNQTHGQYNSDARAVYESNEISDHPLFPRAKDVEFPEVE